MKQLTKIFAGHDPPSFGEMKFNVTPVFSVPQKVGREALVARQNRVEILKNSAEPRGPHILIGAACEIIHQALRHLLREPRDC